jgi:hypothetical protein
MGGRPGVDFQRQKSWNAWRCHRVKVAGCTTTRAWRQSNQRASQTRARRVAAVARRGVTFLVQRQLFAQKEVFWG